MKPGVGRLLVGALVGIALLGLGGSLIGEGQIAGGLVVCALGAYRAATLAVEARRLRAAR